MKALTVLSDVDEELLTWLQLTESAMGYIKETRYKCLNYNKISYVADNVRLLHY